MPYRFQKWEAEQQEYERYESLCKHGWPLAECERCDQFAEMIEEEVDIDKCLNCGRYIASSKLNEDQVCKKGCRNPLEY